MPTYASVLAATVNPAVALEVASMLEQEGPYRVEGVYLACVDRAARQRTLVAERRVADRARRAAWLAKNPTCVWCTQRIVGAVTLIGDAMIGACCIADYERTVFGGALTSITFTTSEPPTIFAPADETDVLVVEHAMGTDAAFDAGVVVGWSDGYHDGEQVAELARSAA